jgi:hypothetical protein
MSFAEEPDDFYADDEYCYEPQESPLVHLDMLQVDRLRAWARNIETHGADISQWGYPQFVSEECTRIADSIEAVIKGAR